jgi:MFS family permease
MDEESGGFKFAITLLATFGTIIYASYTYFQNNAVDNYFYVVIVGVILSLLISSIFLIGYILVRGYSMEVEEPAKTSWKNFASDIYSITFQVGLMQLLLIIGLFLLIRFVGSLFYAIVYLLVVIFSYLFFYELKSCFLKFLDRLKLLILNLPEKIKNIPVNFRVGAMILFLIISTFLLIIIDRSYSYAIVYWLVVIFSYLFFDRLKPLQSLNPFEKKKEIMVIFITLILLVVWTILYTPMFGVIQGRVTIDMNSIYNKNDEQIPVYIEVTGRNDNASIELYQLNSTNPVAALELETDHNSSKNLNGENSTLIGNAFYAGKYYVFINTAKLREGYYELVYTRQIDKYKYGKSFYLLNASKK